MEAELGVVVWPCSSSCLGSPWTPEVGGQPGQHSLFIKRQTPRKTDRQMRGQRKGKEAGKKQKLALVADGSP